MLPALDAPLICVLNFCRNGSGNRGGADAGSGRSGPFVVAGGAGTVEVASLHAFANSTQERLGGIGCAFLVFRILSLSI